MPARVGRVRDIARRNPSSEIQEEEDTAGTRRRRRKPGTACASRERERERALALLWASAQWGAGRSSPVTGERERERCGGTVGKNVACYGRVFGEWMDKKRMVGLKSLP
jgi:hypothetical protein